MCYLNALNMKKKGKWGSVGYLKDGIDEYEIIKGYHVRSDQIEKRNNEVYKSDVE